MTVPGPLLLTALAVALSSTAELSAHRLDVVVRFAGGRIELEASYGDGSPAAGASVSVHSGDGAGEVLPPGRTDARGRSSLVLSRAELPASGLLISVEDGAGHRTRVHLRAEVLLVSLPAHPAEGTRVGAASESDRVLADTRTRGPLASWPLLARAALGVTAIALLALACRSVAHRLRRRSDS